MVLYKIPPSSSLVNDDFIQVQGPDGLTTGFQYDAAQKALFFKESQIIFPSRHGRTHIAEDPIPAATCDTQGLMSANDKCKLDELVQTRLGVLGFMGAGFPDDGGWMQGDVIFAAGSEFINLERFGNVIRFTVDSPIPLNCACEECLQIFWVQDETDIQSIRPPTCSGKLPGTNVYGEMKVFLFPESTIVDPANVAATLNNKGFMPALIFRHYQNTLAPNAAQFELVLTRNPDNQLVTDVGWSMVPNPTQAECIWFMGRDAANNLMQFELDANTTPGILGGVLFNGHLITKRMAVIIDYTPTILSNNQYTLQMWDVPNAQVVGDPFVAFNIWRFENPTSPPSSIPPKALQLDVTIDVLPIGTLVDVWSFKVGEVAGTPILHYYFMRPPTPNPLNQWTPISAVQFGDLVQTRGEVLEEEVTAVTESDVSAESLISGAIIAPCSINIVQVGDFGNVRQGVDFGLALPTTPGNTIFAGFIYAKDPPPSMPTGWVLVESSPQSPGSSSPNNGAWLFMYPNAPSLTNDDFYPSMLTNNDPSFTWLVVMEVEGLDVSPLDKTAVGPASTTTPGEYKSGTTLETAQADEIWIGLFQVFRNMMDFASISDGFAVQRHTSDLGSNGAIHGLIAAKIVNATGQAQATVTMSNHSSNNVSFALMATFKAADCAQSLLPRRTVKMVIPDNEPVKSVFGVAAATVPVETVLNLEDFEDTIWGLSQHEDPLLLVSNVDAGTTGKFDLNHLHRAVITSDIPGMRILPEYLLEGAGTEGSYIQRPVILWNRITVPPPMYLRWELGMPLVKSPVFPPYDLLFNAPISSKKDLYMRVANVASMGGLDRTIRVNGANWHDLPRTGNLRCLWPEERRNLVWNYGEKFVYPSADVNGVVLASHPSVNVGYPGQAGDILELMHQEYTAPCIRVQFTFDALGNVTLQFKVGTLGMDTPYELDASSSLDEFVRGMRAGYMVSAEYIQAGGWTGVGTPPVSNVDGFTIYNGGLHDGAEIWNVLEVMIRNNQVWIWWNGLLIPPNATLSAQLPTPVEVSTPYYPFTLSPTNYGKTGLRLWPGAVVRKGEIRVPPKIFSEFTYGQLELQPQ